MRQTSLPYQTGTPTVWTDIPNTYRTTMRVQYPAGPGQPPAIDQTFYSDDIYGKRLTIFFNTSVQPELRLDGTLVATGPTQSLNTTRFLTVTVTHPYAVTIFNETCTLRIDAPILSGGVQFPSYYLIGSAFGDTREGMVSRFNRKTSEATAAGAAEFSESLLGNQLSVLWSTFVAQQSLIADLTDRMTNCASVRHHIVARALRTTFPAAGTIDVGSLKIQVSSLVPNNTSNFEKNWIIKGTHGFGGEQLSSAQFQGPEGFPTSSHRSIKLANAAGKKIYRATKNNFFADVVPNLTGYTIDMNTLYANHLFFDQVVFLSEEGHQTIFGSVQLDSYIACPPTGAPGGYIFSFKGCVFSWHGYPPEWDACRPPRGGGFPKGPSRMPAEGVFAGQCGFHYSAPAFTTGSSAYPYSLSFEAEYSSCRAQAIKSSGAWLVAQLDSES